jgi:hypothetical protein
VLLRSRWVLAGSPFVKDAVLRISKHIYVSVIGYGVNPADFERPGPADLKTLWNLQGRHVVLSVGQLTPRKGLAENLFEFFRTVVLQMEDFVEPALETCVGVQQSPHVLRVTSQHRSKTHIQIRKRLDQGGDCFQAELGPKDSRRSPMDVSSR